MGEVGVRQGEETPGDFSRKNLGLKAMHANIAGGVGGAADNDSVSLEKNRANQKSVLLGGRGNWENLAIFQVGKS